MRFEPCRRPNMLRLHAQCYTSVLAMHRLQSTNTEKELNSLLLYTNNTRSNVLSIALLPSDTQASQRCVIALKMICNEICLTSYIRNFVNKFRACNATATSCNNVVIQQTSRGCLHVIPADLQVVKVKTWGWLKTLACQDPYRSSSITASALGTIRSQSRSKAGTTELCRRVEQRPNYTSGLDLGLTTKSSVTRLTSRRRLPKQLQAAACLGDCGGGLAEVAACAFSKESRRVAVERDVSNKLLAAWHSEDAGISTCSLPWTGSRSRSWLPSERFSLMQAAPCVSREQCCHHHAKLTTK